MITSIMTFLLGVLVMLLLRPKPQSVERIVLVPQLEAPATRAGISPLLLALCVFAILIGAVFTALPHQTSPSSWQPSSGSNSTISQPPPLSGFAHQVQTDGH